MIVTDLSSYLSFKYKYLREKFEKKWEPIQYWFLYRFHPEYKFHVIDTGLDYGYHEIDDRMLHGMFSLLVDYVEVELAHLWESNTPEDKGLGGENNGRNWIHQQINDPDDDRVFWDEVLQLYTWWKYNRPNRVDEFDFGFPELSDAFSPDANAAKTVMERMTEVMHGQKNYGLQPTEIVQMKEHAYMMEDSEQLIRLIRIRTKLWT